MFTPTRRGMLLGSGAIFLTARAGRLAAQSDETATLRVSGFGGEPALISMENAIARFNERFPNVTVELEVDPISDGWGAYVTKVIGQYSANNSYDIYGTAIETFRAFAARGFFSPLDDFVEGNEGFSDFAPSLFEQGSYEGSIYYVPIGWNNIMINFNRAHFDEAGLEYPNQGWSWEDFRQTAIALTERDGSGNVTRFGYEVPSQNFFVQPWFFTNGTSILTEDWSGSNMLDPKVAESLQFLHDLIHVDRVSPIPGTDTMDNQFMAGQVSMISRGHWIVNNARNAGIDMDVILPPQKEVEATVIGFGAFAVSSRTEHPDLARELLRELVSYEAQIEEGEGGGAVPGMKAAAETEAFLSFPHNADRYYASLDKTIPVPSPVNFQEVEQIFIRNYRAMMAGDMSIEDGVQRTHDELERSFERVRSR